MAFVERGLQTYTVQEAQNASLGQMGSVFLDQSGTTVTTTKPRVVVAITALTDCSFSALVSDITEGEGAFIGTAAASSFGGDQFDAGNHEIPKGVTIYGRWSSVSVQTTGMKCICYLG